MQEYLWLGSVGPTDPRYRSVLKYYIGTVYISTVLHTIKVQDYSPLVLCSRPLKMQQRLQEAGMTDCGP